MQVGAAWFNNDFENLITWSSLSFSMENVAEARTAGLEVFLKWLPSANLTVDGSYTWLPTAENLTTGARLIRRPEHFGTVAAHYRFPRWVVFDTSAQISGSAADSAFAADYSTKDVTNDGYVKWDAGVTVTPWKHLSLVARVENLLDSEYEEAYGFPALGRTFWGGASVNF